ncbi:MAG: glycoside hydrolase family 3 C-terminal domain-containing protein [Lachnospiraceae bacterium]|nr:glycoside hydrolase family 3 C-terminal domain-containing protein [Lachnospiraceae bacterium]
MKKEHADPKDPYRLVTGFGAWHIGSCRVSDGPHGVRAQEDGAKNNDSYEAACFPTASGAACSWDPEMTARMARGIAAEAKELGVSVVLGPGVNIKRSPLCGRNFEYYSEDPLLAGTLASAYVKAMQECGVGTSLKHFACNSQETHRMTSNSMVDRRALHEIYLAAFEQVVREAKPATVMASYNFLNGSPACENRYLLTDVLRNRWGFEGLVMSDWGACVDLPACIEAGMDVEMPDSRGAHYKALRKAVEEGRVKASSMERALQRVRELCERYPERKPEGAAPQVSEETREHSHRLAGEIAEECAVLLKNEGFFPLPAGSRILIVGDLAARPRIQGGGSSHIHTERIDDPVEEFRKLGAEVRFVRGYACDTAARNEKLEQEAVSAVREAAESGTPILFFGGLTDMAEGEGYDRDSFGLPENQKALLSRILEITDRIGFLSFGGAPYDMTLPDRCRGVLQLYLGGEAVGSACARIVLGEVTPSGKLAESIPFSEKDVPSCGYFGRQGEQALHPDDVEYRESIFVGYRYYDTFQKPVRYCFGHGLSYTYFAYSDLKLARDEEGRLLVCFTLENTGERPGKEVCQVYVKNPEGDAFRPARELRGFAKVYAEPGEKKQVEIPLGDRAFSVWQDEDFRVIGGIYEIQVGASLQDIRLRLKTTVEGEALRSPLTLQHAVPLSDSDFGRIYEGERTRFSDLQPGDYTRKNSLAQMRAHSGLARAWAAFGRAAIRMMFPGRPAQDPEIRMMTEGLLEGNIDSVSSQSGGLLGKRMVDAIIASANRR